MKQFVFLYVTEGEPLINKEYKIEAAGMLDAFLQAKKIKEQLEKETKSTVHVNLKGVSYSGIA